VNFNEKTNTYHYRGEEICELLDIAPNTFSGRNKYYLEKLQAEKQGKGKNAEYTTTYPILPPFKVRFEKFFGFKTSRPALMNGYLTLLFENMDGFAVSDGEVAGRLGTQRRGVRIIREELEKNGWLLPLKSGTPQYHYSSLNDKEGWKVDKEGEKWKAYFAAVRLCRQGFRDMSEDPQERDCFFFESNRERQERLVYYNAATMVGYEVRKIYNRDCHYFRFYQVVEKWNRREDLKRWLVAA
jgi:hypothetical protein